MLSPKRPAPPTRKNWRRLRRRKLSQPWFIVSSFARKPTVGKPWAWLSMIQQKLARVEQTPHQALQPALYRSATLEIFEAGTVLGLGGRPADGPEEDLFDSPRIVGKLLADPGRPALRRDD